MFENIFDRSGGFAKVLLDPKVIGALAAAGQAEVMTKMVTKYSWDRPFLIMALTNPEVVEALAAAGQTQVVESIVAKVLADKDPRSLALLIAMLPDPKVIKALVAAGQAQVVVSVMAEVSPMLFCTHGYKKHVFCCDSHGPARRPWAKRGRGARCDGQVCCTICGYRANKCPYCAY